MKTRILVAGILLIGATTIALTEFNLTDVEFARFKAEKEKLSHKEEASLHGVIMFAWNGTGKIFEPTTTDNSILNKPNINVFDTEYGFGLNDGKLKINKDGRIIWQSPSSWWIDSLQMADADNDGLTDLNLSVWKRGNFGSSKPFWVGENDQSIKNHFFVFKFKNEKIIPVWQSSNLENPNCEFAFGDVDNDEKQELVVIEGDYGPNWDCKGKFIAVWKWNGWGFTNEWRSNEGNYKNLRIREAHGKDVIIAEYKSGI